MTYLPDVMLPLVHPRHFGERSLCLSPEAAKEPSSGCGGLPYSSSLLGICCRGI